MTRQQLEDLLATITTGRDIRVIVAGRHAILGKFPGADHLLEQDCEVTLLDGHSAMSPALPPLEALPNFWPTGGSIRLLKPQDLDLPEGWQFRLIGIGNPVAGWCLEPNDLAIALSASHAEADQTFIKLLQQADLLDQEIILARSKGMGLESP